jgi:peptidoglycan/LPS O-acetylase OafA/YrhL
VRSRCRPPLEGSGMKTELSALTGARGLAAWFVVLFHLRGAMTLPEGVLAILAKGYLAVDFFFLLSGFVIWITYVERIRLARWQAVPTFLLRRVARIWPLHLTMLAFAVAIAMALPLTGHPPDPRFPFSDLPAHILLLQNWPIVVQRFGITSLDWNDPAWSISSEMFAYLLFPLIVMAVDWRRVPTVVLLAVIAATIALLSHVMTSRGVHHLGDAIPYFGQVRCGSVIATARGSRSSHRLRSPSRRSQPSRRASAERSQASRSHWQAFCSSSHSPRASHTIRLEVASCTIWARSASRRISAIRCCGRRSGSPLSARPAPSRRSCLRCSWRSCSARRSFSTTCWSARPRHG